MSFHNTQIKTLLRGAMALLCVILVVVGVTGLHGISRSNDALRETYGNQLVSAQALSEAMFDATRARTSLGRLVMQGEVPPVKETVDRANAAMEAAELAWKRYLALAQTDEERPLSEDLAAKRKAFTEKGIAPLRAAVLAGNQDEAAKLAQAVLPELQRAMLDAYDKLEAFQMHAGEASFNAAQKRFEQTRIVTFALIALGLAIAVLCTLALRRAIVKPVQEALGVFERIAQGDLTSRITSVSKNEIGR